VVPSSGNQYRCGGRECGLALARGARAVPSRARWVRVGNPNWPRGNAEIYLDKADQNIIYDDITVIDNALTRPDALNELHCPLLVGIGEHHAPARIRRE
jgi:hypothetical protein